MRMVFSALVISCILYVIHWIIPQPNGAGDLAGMVAGAALLIFLATVEITRK